MKTHMEKAKSDSLPIQAEQVFDTFFAKLQLAAEREQYRQRFQPLYDALKDLDIAAIKLAERTECLAKVIVDIAEGAKNDANDGEENRIWHEGLKPLVDSLKEQMSKSKHQKRKPNKLTIDTEILAGIVAFGNKRSYPSTWPSATPTKSIRFLSLLGGIRKEASWLTLFLCFRVIQFWCRSTGLGKIERLENMDLSGRPDDTFSLQIPGHSIWTVKRSAGSGRQAPIELITLTKALYDVAPHIGPTKIARRFIELAEVQEIKHPLVEQYATKYAKSALERQIKRIRSNIRQENTSQ